MPIVRKPAVNTSVFGAMASLMTKTRPDKSGVIAHCDRLNSAGQAQLVLTLGKDANYETLLRIHDWFADINIAQILYRTNGTHHMMIQGRDGTGVSGTYVPVDNEGMRFLQAEPIDFKKTLEVK